MSKSRIYTAFRQHQQPNMPQKSFTLSELPTPMVYATHRMIRECNAAFAGLFGYQPHELANTGFHLLYPKFADFVRVGDLWRNNLGGGKTYYDERIMRHRDQSRFWCQVHGRSNSDPDPFAEAVYCFEPISRPLMEEKTQLTDRQLQIVTLVSQGKKNREIAVETNLSQRTIEAHRARMMRTIGVKNSAELVAWFQQQN